MPRLKSSIAILVVTTALTGQEPPEFKGLDKLPDPRTGEIGGQPAIVVWPVERETHELLDVDGCNVILERHDTKAFSYLTYPCGQWFVPDIARYDMWVEMPGYVSDYSTVYAFGGGLFQGVGSRSLHDVVPAGKVRLKPGSRTPAGAETFRVLSLRDQWITYQRVVAASEATNVLSVPAGRVIAGFFDAGGNALTLTRPLEVSPDETLEFTATTPNDGDLLLVVGKNGRSEKSPPPEVKALARNAGKDRSPDILLNGRDQLFAIWYGLKGERTEVIATPYLPQPQVTMLRSHGVNTLRRAYDNPQPLAKPKPKPAPKRE